jgi:alpha-1,2-mannosyltransferase
LLLWQLGSLAALWGALRLMPRLAGEEPAPLTSTAVLVPLLMSARLLQEHFQHTQINIYVLFLILLAFHLFQQRHNGLGGLALAVAVSLRAVPVILLLYLLYKRAWRAAAWTGGFLLVINLFLPVAVFGSNEAAERWRSWRAIATAETQDPTPGYSNQSLLAALKRFLTNAGSARDPVKLAVVDWPTERVVRLFYVFLAAIGVAFALVFWGNQSTPAVASTRLFGELAVILVLMPLISPLAWKAHFVTVLVGYWLIWRVMPPPGKGRWVWSLWWASLVCLTLSAPALVGTRARSILESWNVITVGALLVLGLTVWAAKQPLPRPRANSEEPR